MITIFLALLTILDLIFLIISAISNNVTNVIILGNLMVLLVFVNIGYDHYRNTGVWFG